MLGGVSAALALIDVEKYYASMDLLILFQKANERVFPTRVSLQRVSQYLAPRSILSQQWVSKAIFVGRSITAGEGNGNNFAKVMIHSVLHWYTWNYCLVSSVRQWVDDLALLAVGTKASIRSHFPEALHQLNRRLKGVKLKVASKSVLLASDARLARDLGKRPSRNLELG